MSEMAGKGRNLPEDAGFSIAREKLMPSGGFFVKKSNGILYDILIFSKIYHKFIRKVDEEERNEYY